MTRLDPAKYDRMKDYRDTHFDIPDKTAALLIRFLKQGVGQLARRAGTGEFRELAADEATRIEEKFKDIFLSSDS